MKNEIRDQIVDVFVDDLNVVPDDDGYRVIMHCITSKQKRVTIELQPAIFGRRAKRRRVKDRELVSHLLADLDESAFTDPMIPGDANCLHFEHRLHAQLRGRFFKLLCDFSQKDKHEWVGFPRKGKVIDPFHIETEAEKIAAADAELGA